MIEEKSQEEFLTYELAAEARRIAAAHVSRISGDFCLSFAVCDPGNVMAVSLPMDGAQDEHDRLALRRVVCGCFDHDRLIDRRLIT